MSHSDQHGEPVGSLALRCRARARLGRRLGPTRADPSPALTALTARYDAARYRDAPATVEDAAAARAAWEALRQD